MTDEELQHRPLGKGEVLAQGGDILIITLGHMYKTGFEVRYMLTTRADITATVLDPVFLKLFDMGGS